MEKVSSGQMSRRLTSDIPSAWKAPVVPRVHPEWHHSGTHQDLWTELQGSYADTDGKQETALLRSVQMYSCACAPPGVAHLLTLGGGGRRTVD
ncbi:hypothetical protein LEMLEM_LOCUS19294 [Lemmus lemmus]